MMPSPEETSASFVRLSRAHTTVEDLSSQVKVAKEEYKAAFEQHMTIGRRFQLAQSALEGAKAMDQYREDLARAAAPAPLRLPASNTIYAEAGEEGAAEVEEHLYGPLHVGAPLDGQYEVAEA